MTAAATCWLAFSAVGSWANSATLIGGEGSEWKVSDDATTDNGAPVGGECTLTGVAGDGASTRFGTLPFTADVAFDMATMVWVNGVQVGGVGVFGPSEANFAPVAIAGLTAQMTYRALSTQATLRVLLRLTNATGSMISVPVEYGNNFSSNRSTEVEITSSGDSTYGPEDRWIVTSDGPRFDPVNTSVFYGPNSPLETPVFTTAEVFWCLGTEGSLDRFILEIAPGATETLMFFQELNRDVADAYGYQYDTTPALGHPLTEGMTPADLGTIVNWSYGPAPPPECSDGADNDGDGKVDHPADPQCDSASDPSERPQCLDNLENDADGRIDHPNDPGCRSGRDNSEAPNPQCSDGVDNDGDGRIDYPHDQGCRSARDNSEGSDGPPTV